MTEETFSRAHLSELERFAASSADDPFLGPQDRDRLTRARRQAPPAEEAGPSVRAAFFLRGGGVEGQRGVDAVLAGQALAQAGKMFTEQAILQERASSRGVRRPRGAKTPGVLFTGTPRGSFGFELEPNTHDQELRGVHATALDGLLATIGKVAAGDSDDDIDAVPTSVLPHLKLFFKTLADHDAEIRLVDTRGTRSSVGRARVTEIAGRLARQVEEKEIQRRCTFRGLTLETRQFDLLTEEEVLTGTVSSDLTDADVHRIHGYLDREGTATLVRTRILHPGRPETVTYLLTGASLAEEEPGDRESADQPPA